MFRQQQVLLRTLPPPSTLFFDWLKLWWAWKGDRRRPYVRSPLLAILSLGFISTTIIVSIFAAFVISNSDVQVLVDSPYCGPFRLDNEDLNIYVVRVESTGRVYAEACYQDFSGEAIPEACRVNIQPNIPFTNERVA
jgi:hypothetical protein